MNFFCPRKIKERTQFQIVLIRLSNFQMLPPNFVVQLNVEQTKAFVVTVRNNQSGVFDDDDTICEAVSRGLEAAVTGKYRTCGEEKNKLL